VSLERPITEKECVGCGYAEASPTKTPMLTHHVVAVAVVTVSCGRFPPTTADQLVQMDTTSIAEKLAKMALGGGLPGWEDVDKDGKPVGEAALSEADEDAIVDNYRRVDGNMAEVGRALREGRRIRFKPDNGKKKKKKKGALHVFVSPLALRSTCPSGTLGAHGCDCLPSFWRLQTSRRSSITARSWTSRTPG